MSSKSDKATGPLANNLSRGRSSTGTLAEWHTPGERLSQANLESNLQL
jgi:hypothetical protein